MSIIGRRVIVQTTNQERENNPLFEATIVDKIRTYCTSGVNSDKYVLETDEGKFISIDPFYIKAFINNKAQEARTER